MPEDPLESKVEAAILERHDVLCMQFENAIQAGEHPLLEESLARVPEHERPALAALLLPIEIWWRRQAGETPQAAEYLSRLPSTDLGSVLAQAFGEAFFAVQFDVQDGSPQGRTRTVTRHETFVVGRDESCQLHCPDDPRLSRFHFRLEVNPPEARVVDLDSRNGTRVNDERVRTAELCDGDEITAGRTRIRVRIRTPAAPIAPSPFRPDVAKNQDHDSSGPVTPPSVPGHTLKDEIGRGGLGVVYRAIRKATKRVVAVKLVLPSRSAETSATQLFLREANILNQLKHPRIVEFLEVGIAGKQVYLVMEFVERIAPETLWAGMSWDRRMKVACGIALQTLEGLVFAHSLGIVHRDVKPSNLLMFRNGRKLNVKLADFGLAKNYQFAGFSDLTDDRDARGTLAFMAPEQVIDCRFAGPSCDIYAVGVTLYQLLAGELPFEFDKSHSALATILEGKPIPLESRCPGVPPALARLVHRAIERDAANRFDSAKQMQRQLSKAVTGR